MKYIVLLLLLGISLYTDTKYYKIRNCTTISAALVGGLLNSIQHGLLGFKSSVLGLLIPSIILFVLYVLNMIGAGDVKLIGAVGAILGIEFILKANIYIFIAGGGIALIKMIVEGNMLIRFKYLWNYLKSIFYQRNIEVYCDLKNETKCNLIRFSYAICIGTIIQLIIDMI